MCMAEEETFSGSSGEDKTSNKDCDDSGCVIGKLLNFL